MIPGYLPIPETWWTLPGPVLVSGPEKIRLVIGACRSPAHDPAPDAPYWLVPGARTGWALPWLPLPSPGLLVERGPVRAKVPGWKREDPAKDPGASVAWLWDAVQEIRLSLGLPAGELPRLYALLPAIRWDACIRLSKRGKAPATLGRALARLRTMAVMCDPADEGDSYWVMRLRSGGIGPVNVAEFERAMPALRKQVTEGIWPAREAWIARRMGGGR